MEQTSSIQELIAQMASRRLTEAEFARAVGVSPRKLADLRRRNLIRYRRDGHTVYYLPEDVPAYHAAMLRDPSAKRVA
ncbi:MAG TPA: hypothetical protein VNQ79_06585 [Blastocatellia bacterium]|nr:hypothetical protein [Blastocatellia bacterium]